MATYKVKSKGTEHTVNVVDNATGGATVTIEGCDETFEVAFAGGTGAEIAAANAAAGGQQVATALPVAVAASPTPAAAAPVAAARPTAAPAAAGAGSVVAPIPGKILSIVVAVGDAVELNQVLLTLEAMKMENNVAAPSAGTVQSIEVSVGSEVAGGQVLIVIA